MELCEPYNPKQTQTIETGDHGKLGIWEYWIYGPLDLWTMKRWDYGIMGSRDFRTTGLWDHQTVGP